MKRCNACEEEFADKFSFCPVDGTPLNSLARALVGEKPGAEIEIFASQPSALDRPALTRRGEFNVTMIAGAGLASRLVAEVSFVARQLHLAWPEFQRDPIGLSTRALAAVINRCREFILSPNVLAAGVTAMLVVLSAVVALMLFGHGRPSEDGPVADLELPVVEILSLRPPVQQTQAEGSSVGINGKGLVGLASGKGEGSESRPQDSRGGGGGGNGDRAPAQVGSVPPPSNIPAPINPPLPNAALPAAGVDLDPALWKSLPAATYGDPKSTSTVASKGPGEGEGIGTGNGQGIGEGDGNGLGPGNDGNMGGGNKASGNKGPGGGRDNNPRDADRIIPTNALTQRAKVISKPEPGYTEEARKLDITGTVVLRVIFSVSGEVTGIRAIKPLPGGLTERAIAAARQIRFVPAMKDGQPVSCYMQLEYNFNLY